ncbi:hypothetical protein ACIPUG_13105 [Pectobacterium sp. CHL-2024]|uniref:hypothetical protein n=1 Tax=Pectobacterium sp. CHL-2024 TaxID=3377079 RepID=UPI0038276E20
MINIICKDININLTFNSKGLLTSLIYHFNIFPIDKDKKIKGKNEIKIKKTPLKNKLIRNKCISIRLNEKEISLLDSKRKHISRAEWLRMASLHKLPSVIPQINIEAWKALGEISQKLNRLVVHLDNKGNDSPLSQTELFAVKRQIVEIRQHLITDNLWSASHEGNAKNPQG